MRPSTSAATPAAKTESRMTQPTPPSTTTRPFPVSNVNMAGSNGAATQGDQIRAALDTLGIKLIKSEAERDVLKKLVEETRNQQARLERELLENRKELSDTRRKMDEQRQESELSKSRHERLEEKLRDTQAGTLKITRKLEADEQKRNRMQRRMERLETVAEEATQALQSRAMVLLTDQTLAQKSGMPMMAAGGPALPMPVKSAYGDVLAIDNETPQITAWWQQPLKLNTTAAAMALIVALGIGFLASTSINNGQNAVAVLQDGSLARIDLRNGTLQPLQLSLKKLDTTPAPVETPKVSAEGQPLPQTKPVAIEAAPAVPAAAIPASAPAKDAALTGAMKDLQDKAYAGIAEAQHDLAALYTAGSGVKQDYKRASYWFHQAASAGVANAAYNLGVLHHQGLGVDKDITAALDWYRQAALEGHPEAQYNLGIAYIEGIGTKYNPQLAAGFFQKAALSGITEAAYNLGLILENGLLAEPKPNQAMMWYRLGSEGGSTEAKNALDQLATRLGLDPAKAGFLPDGSSLSKLVKKPDSANAVATTDTVGALAKAMPELADMIPDTAQLTTAQIQEQLTRRSLYDGPEDGAMSQKTVDAIKSYQKVSGLKVEGKADTATLMRMLRESTAQDDAAETAKADSN